MAAKDCNGDGDALDPGEGAGQSCSVGQVVVSLTDYDGASFSAADGTIDQDEAQCAIDCLDGNPAPDWAIGLPFSSSPVIDGGTITFLPGVLYKIRHELHLPARTIGALHIVGYGATLYNWLSVDENDRAIFSRRAPDLASDGDVENMAGSDWTLWTFEGLTFIGAISDGEEEGSLPMQTGIYLDGTHGITIRNCRFKELGRGIEMHFSLLPTITDCTFNTNYGIDVFLGDSSDCDFGRCWLGTGGGTSTCCNAPRLLNDYFDSGFPNAMSVVLHDPSNPIIANCVFEGVRPKHAVFAYGQTVTTQQLMNTYFEYHDSTPSPNAIVFNAMNGHCVIDCVQITCAPNDLFYDVSQAGRMETSIQNIDQNNFQIADGISAFGHSWHFETNFDTGTPFNDPARWLEGYVPVAVTVDSTDSLDRRELKVLDIKGYPASAGGYDKVFIKSPVQATVELEVPRIAPSTLASGQVWFDLSTNHLVYCCDGSGHPVQLP